MGYPTVSDPAYTGTVWSSFVRQIVLNLNILERRLKLDPTVLWCMEPGSGRRVFSWITLGRWKVTDRIDEVRKGLGLAKFEWPAGFDLYNRTRFMSFDDLNRLARAVGEPGVRMAIQGAAIDKAVILFQETTYTEESPGGYLRYQYRLEGDPISFMRLSHVERCASSGTPERYSNRQVINLEKDEPDGWTGETNFWKMRTFYHAHVDTFAFLPESKQLYRQYWNRFYDIGECAAASLGRFPDPEAFAAATAGALTVGGMVMDSGSRTISPSIPSGKETDLHTIRPTAYAWDRRHVPDIGPVPGITGGPGVTGGLFYRWYLQPFNQLQDPANGLQLLVSTNATLKKSRSLKLKADQLMRRSPVYYEFQEPVAIDVDPPALRAVMKFFHPSTGAFGETVELLGTKNPGLQSFVADLPSVLSGLELGFLCEADWSGRPPLRLDPPFQQGDFSILPYVPPANDPITLNAGLGFQREIGYAEWETDLPDVWLAAKR